MRVRVPWEARGLKIFNYRFYISSFLHRQNFSALEELLIKFIDTYFVTKNITASNYILSKTKDNSYLKKDFLIR